MTNHLSKIDTQRWGTPAVLLVGALFSAILVAGYAWQDSKSESKLQEAVAHAEAAVFLQEATIERSFAADILDVYVLGGDESLIRRFQNQSRTSLARLAGAISSSGSDEVQQVADQGASVASSADSVVALRQAGDAEAAGQALAELDTKFETLDVAIQSVVDAEFATAVSLTTNSHNAYDTASWLLITSMATAIATVVGILSAARRSLFSRPARQNPSSA